jgi:hypothetical protein
MAGIARRLGLRLTRIGSIARQRGDKALVTVLDAAGLPIAMKRAGYEHFSG